MSAQSIWESAIQELKRLLDGLAATRSGSSRPPVRTAERAPEAPKPVSASQQTATPQGSDSMQPSATPESIVKAPPAAPVPPTASAPAAVVASAPTMFDAKHISALLAALAGTGISGSSLLKAVQEGINHTPSERWLPIAAVIVGLIVAFFAFKFLLQRIHRNHAGHEPDADFFGGWRRILTSRRTLGLIVTVAGTLAAGAGGTMIYQRSSQPVKAPATTETSPVSETQQHPTMTATDAPKVGNNTTYGIAGSGLVALLGGLWMVYRRTFPAPPTATSKEPVGERPPEVSTPSFPAPPPPVQVSTPAPADAATNEPELAPFAPGNPVAILLAHDTTFTRLRDLFGLDSFSCNVLLLTVACEADPGVADRCAQLQNGSPFPSAGLAIALFLAPDSDRSEKVSATSASDAGVERAAKVASLAADAPLRAWRLIETFQPEGRNLLGATLKTDEPILHYLLGHPLRDERLERFRAPLAPDALAGQVARSQWNLARTLAPRIAQGEFCELRGRDSVSKQLVALAAEGWRADEESTATAAADAHARGTKMLDRVVCSSLPKEAVDSLLFAMLWLRQSLLLGGALYLDLDDADAPEQLAALRLFLRGLSTLPPFNASAGVGGPHIFISTYEALPDLDAPHFSIVVAKPERSEQEKEWEDLVRNGDVAAQLADEFDFNLPTVTRLHGIAAGGQPVADISTIRGVCRQSHRSQLDALAQRVIPVADWDALVLPAFQKNILRALADQVRHRGRVYRKFGFDQTMNRGFGISALFTGESGTGKTTAAEVIAADLGCDLYRVDLSAVVDKFVGETEKKLRRVFDAAEEGGVALCFDEADAIFGRRSEVKDSHDRYANIQINYLLQRLENFSGLAILTSNQADAIDQAFLRRLRFIVNFPMPDRELRREIWQRVFPVQFMKDVPCEPPFADALWETLAETPLSGGQIHAVALNAAFLAARETPPHLTVQMIEHAMDAEFLKTGNPVRHTTFPAPPEPPAETSTPEPPLAATQAAA